MVTIFDMVTGEIIADDSHSDTTTEAHRAQHSEAGLIAPRLQTVEETSTTETRPGMPADLAGADIASFLSHQ